MLLHCASAVHLVHWFDAQMGAVAGQSFAELSTQSTHLPVLVLQVVPMSSHTADSRPLHWPHVPPGWQAGELASRLAQAESPASLFVHSSHACALVSQMGVALGH